MHGTHGVVWRQNGNGPRTVRFRCRRALSPRATTLFLSLNVASNSRRKTRALFSSLYRTCASGTVSSFERASDYGHVSPARSKVPVNKRIWRRPAVRLDDGSERVAKVENSCSERQWVERIVEEYRTHRSRARENDFARRLGAPRAIVLLGIRICIRYREGGVSLKYLSAIGCVARTTTSNRKRGRRSRSRRMNANTERFR